MVKLKNGWLEVLLNYYVALPAFINKGFNISGSCNPYVHYNIWNKPMRLGCGDQEEKNYAGNYITDSSWAAKTSV